MVWNGKWNATEILLWNMEDARMEDFKSGMEDNLHYQFHTRFRALYLQKGIYIHMSGGDK